MKLHKPAFVYLFCVLFPLVCQPLGGDTNPCDWQKARHYTVYKMHVSFPRNLPEEAGFILPECQFDWVCLFYSPFQWQKQVVVTKRCQNRSLYGRNTGSVATQGGNLERAMKKKVFWENRHGWQVWSQGAGQTQTHGGTQSHPHSHVFPQYFSTVATQPGTSEAFFTHR